MEKEKYNFNIDLQLNNDKILNELIKELTNKKLTISCAESLTGGLIAKLITDIDGASSVFSYAVVSYSAQAKIKLLNVSEDTINKFGVVSENVAYEMANGIRKISNSDISVATTGIAGPCNIEEKPVGLVYIAVSSNNYNSVVRLYINENNNYNRQQIRKITAITALKLAIKALNYY